MKLLRFSEYQLRQTVDYCLVAEHIKVMFYRMLECNHTTITDYLSCIFNLGMIPHYTQLCPSNTSNYEYEGVVADFERIRESLTKTDIYKVYGIDPLDAIYQHTCYTTGYDSFKGEFFEDLYSLLESVDHDNGPDYLQDISFLLRYLVESIERYFISDRETTEPVYISVHSYLGELTVLVK